MTTEMKIALYHEFVSHQIDKLELIKIAYENIIENGNMTNPWVQDKLVAADILFDEVSKAVKGYRID